MNLLKPESRFLSWERKNLFLFKFLSKFLAWANDDQFSEEGKRILFLEYLLDKGFSHYLSLVAQN